MTAQKHHPSDRVWIEHILGRLFAANPETRSALASVLDPVARYDKANGTDLLRTLQVFVRLDLSPSATAKSLGIHRHTISYRINQVERLLGRSIRSGPGRLVTEIALLARAFGAEKEES